MKYIICLLFLLLPVKISYNNDIVIFEKNTNGFWQAKNIKGPVYMTADPNIWLIESNRAGWCRFTEPKNKKGPIIVKAFYPHVGYTRLDKFLRHTIVSTKNGTTWSTTIDGLKIEKGK